MIGKACKGREAARVLAAIVLSPALAEVLAVLSPETLDDARRALAAFGPLSTLPERLALVERLALDGPDLAGFYHALPVLTPSVREYAAHLKEGLIVRDDPPVAPPLLFGGDHGV